MAQSKKQKQPPVLQTAVIYARYSSSAQNDASIEQQVAECRAYADLHSLAVTMVYEDRAMTGRNDRRPGFQRMIRAAERGEFSVLLTYKSNRLARNMLDALRYESRLDKAGVRVIYCKEDFGDNAAGRLALRMMMSINEFYSENLSEDVQRGMLDSARKCQVVGSIPYGYRKADDGTYAIDETAAPIVREIFERVLNGELYSAIAADLNARGIRTRRGNAWGKGSFHCLLACERYTGVYIYKDVRIEGGMPQIVPRETFDAVQSVIADRNAFAGRHRSNHDFELTGKLYCGACLSPMVGISGANRWGEQYYYYSCNGKRVDKICDRRNVRKEYVEEQVARAVTTSVLQDDMVEWIADTIMAKAEQQKAASKLGYYESRLAATKKQIANIVRAIEMGVAGEEVKARMDELQADKQTLQGKLALEKQNLFQLDRPRVVYFLETIRQGDPADPTFRRRIIRDFVQAVYLYDDHLKLVVDFTGQRTTYEIPISPPEGDEGLYKRTLPAPQVPYTNPRTASWIEAAGRGFVITWYFDT